MKAVDTNILARTLVRDDIGQTAVADAVLSAGAFVFLTVLLETVWLLGSRYKVSRAILADTFCDILDRPEAAVEDADGVRWAIAQYRNGVDIADAIHVVASGRADSFVTLDRNAFRSIGDPPIPIEIVQ